MNLNNIYIYIYLRYYFLNNILFFMYICLNLPILCNEDMLLFYNFNNSYDEIYISGVDKDFCWFLSFFFYSFSVFSIIIVIINTITLVYDWYH